MKRIISVLLCMVLTINTFIIATNTDIMSAQAASYADQLRSKGFPESYISDLTALHNKYPNWIFEPLNTGYRWSYAISQERSRHSKQLIEKIYSDTSWYCSCSSCYKNGSYVIQEASNWVSASEMAVQYYMDPRNWLTEQGIFQFESTAYDGTQTINGIETILNGTWMYNSNIEYKDAKGKAQTYKDKNGNPVKYSKAILEAANNSGMSAYYLASKIRQEVGGAKPTAGGASGTSSTYPGIYNYYNIAAYTGALDGLKWASQGGSPAGYYTNCTCNLRQKATTSSTALVQLPSNTALTYKSTTTTQDDGYKWYNVTVTYGGKSYTGYIRQDLVTKKAATTATYGRPWTDPYKSIYYGAKYIAGNFSTQTSGYLQKFNVNPASSEPFNHEYMANVAAAVAESKTTYNAYVKANILSVTKTFQIPIFNDMDNPEETAFTSANGISKGFKLSWKKSNDATGYEIQYSTKSDFTNAATVDITSGDITSKSITGRMAEKTYYLRIRAYKASNGVRLYSEWSPSRSVTTRGDFADFTNVTAITKGFKLSWNKVTNADGYEIQYSTKSDFTNAATVVVTPNTTTTTTITGRMAERNYYLRMRSYKTEGSKKVYSDWSLSEKVLTLPELPPAETAFTAVSGVIKGFKLGWSKSSDATGYEIQYSTKSDFTNAATIDITSGTTVSKTVTGRVANKVYYVRIRAYKAVSSGKLYSKWSDSRSVKTLAEQPPAATAFTAVSGVVKGFKLGWSKSTDATGYEIQYSTKSDFTNAATIDITSGGTVSKTVTGRVANKVYYVRIRAYKTSGSEKLYSSWSASKSVKTLAEQPPAATAFTAVSGVTKGFKLGWSKSSDATGYEIQYSTKSDFTNAATIDITSGGTVSKTVTGRMANRKYYVRIRAYKTANSGKVYSSWSTSKSVTTL